MVVGRKDARSANLPSQSRLSDITIDCAPNILVSDTVTRAHHGQLKHLLALSCATDKRLDTVNRQSSSSTWLPYRLLDIRDSRSSAREEEGVFRRCAEGCWRGLQQGKNPERWRHPCERSSTDRGRA